MKLFAGIDVGSVATKVVLLDADARVVGRGLSPSPPDLADASSSSLEQALEQAGATRSDLAGVVSTGFGRESVGFASGQRTEIDCHARGAFHCFPMAMVVVDIGGQDNKLIHVDARGRRLQFILNRKCASGTGAFLEELAMRLRIPLERLSELASQSQRADVRLGSHCTVFAMTEILSRIREGVPIEALVRAAYGAVARRILEAGVITGEVVATGGVVAYHPLLREILALELGTPVHLPPFPQYIGALGAALAAAQEVAIPCNDC